MTNTLLQIQAINVHEYVTIR